MAAERVGEREARLHVHPHLRDGAAELVAARLLLEHVDGAEERHARRDHRGELARGDRQLLRLDPLPAADVVAEVGGLLLLDVEDDQPLGTELRGDGLLVLAVELAARGDPREIDRREGERRHECRNVQVRSPGKLLTSPAPGLGFGLHPKAGVAGWRTVLIRAVR